MSGDDFGLAAMLSKEFRQVEPTEDDHAVIVAALAAAEASEREHRSTGVNLLLGWAVWVFALAALWSGVVLAIDWIRSLPVKDLDRLLRGASSVLVLALGLGLLFAGLLRLDVRWVQAAKFRRRLFGGE